MRRRPATPTAVGVAVAAAVAAGVVFRFVTRSDLWLDEALTVNIARLPLGELPGALRRDGAPPLYYVLLHVWTGRFGSSDLAVRSLSGLLGVVALPLGWWAGTRLGRGDAAVRRRRAVAVLVVLATSPYAIRYATETRMYALVIVLVLAAYLALRAALDRPRLWALAALAVLTSALLYTQYWALYLVAATGGLLAWWAWRGGARRGPARRALVALAVGVAGFLPWLGVFLHQLAHTGTPWDRPTSPPTAAALGLLEFAGGIFPSGAPEGWLLVGPLLAAAVVALTGRAPGPWRVDLDLRTVPGVRPEWFAAAATLLGGLTVSYLAGSGFQPRYAAVMYPLFVLVVGYGIAVLEDRRLRALALAGVALLGLVGGVRNVVKPRTQATQVAAAIRAEGRPGDVVGFCPDQLGPATTRLLAGRPGLQLRAWPFLDGRFGNPRFVDWTDYAERNARADPGAFARALLDTAGPDGTVWFVWSPGYRTFGRACEDALNALWAARPDRADLVPVDQDVYEFMALARFRPAP
jgi:hypothetical protein